ncbi:hypothetical protein HZU77_015685 [Neisseriaceae bacterium TC5R-5]|nr:hypothetical protein [Neisseriaceae bacterium TC5R-5]
MRIACLHTAASNISLFETAAQHLGLPAGTLQHTVRADLLAAAEQAAELSKDIIRSTQQALAVLQQHACAVLLSCSTLGPAVDAFNNTSTVPVQRVDALLAEAAAKIGGRIVVLCAAPSTLLTSSQLFHAAAQATNSSMEIQLVPRIWTMFQTGDQQGYLSGIVQAANQAYIDGANIVVLAQASMAAAADLITMGPTPLSSPQISLAAVSSQVFNR